MLGLILAASVARAATHAAGDIIGNVVSEKVAANKQAAIESQRLQEQMRQEMLQRNTVIRENTLKELYAKMAICCYISWADGVITPEERHNMNAVFMEICNQFANDKRVEQELTRIYSTPNFSFINLEKYLHNTTPEAIASFLQVADEISASDGDSSEEERLCIYKIRKYLTDRTGQNYMGHSLSSAANIDLRCPGCAATMEYQPHYNRAVCPFCGNVKLLGGQDYSPVQVNDQFTFRCPVCSSLLSATRGTTRCICGKCKSGITLNGEQPSLW